jgi:hypothetical protein
MFLFLLSILTFANELYISEERATLWNSSDPGYMFDDCRNPGDQTVLHCERRLAWPEGGEAVIPTKATERIYGIDYAFVQMGSEHGWIEASAIDANTRKLKSDAVLYSKPGLSAGRCREVASELNRCQSPCQGQSGERRAKCLRNCLSLEADKKSCAPKNSQNPTGQTYLRQDTEFSSVSPSRIRLKEEEFYYVKYNKEGISYTGWIHEASLSKTSLDYSEAEPEPNTATEGEAECISCEIANANPERPKSALEQRLEAIETGGYKNSNEIERFACLHSDSGIYGNEKGFSKAKFCAYFKTEQPSLKEQIRKAAIAFEIPEAIVACTLLVESGMYHRPNERKHYRGMAQFGASAVKDLKRYLDNEREPYDDMWKRYTQRPTSDFNDRYIRNTKDVEIVVGAASLYAKWFFVNRIPTTGCTGCSGSTSQPNKKDIDLFIAGYNWSPYGTGRIATLNAAELRNENIIPPPKETKGYLRKMDRCLQPGQFDKFINNSVNSSTQSRAGECNGPC